MTPTDLKQRTHVLATPAEVDAFLRSRPQAVLLKLGSCRKNDVALQEVQARLAQRADLELGLVYVIVARAASDRIAERSGIVHESPQLILFRDGRPVFDRDNWDITPEAVAEGLAALDAASEPKGALVAQD